MTISRRLALAAAAAVAVAVMGASVGAYFAVRSKLVGEVDAALGKRAHIVQRLAASADALFGPPLTPLVRTLTPPPQRADRFGGAAGIEQYVSSSGSVVSLSESHARLPVERADAQGRRRQGGRELSGGDGRGAAPAGAERAAARWRRG